MGASCLFTQKEIALAPNKNSSRISARTHKVKLRSTQYRGAAIGALYVRKIGKGTL
jgi:hypothetical protein